MNALKRMPASIAIVLLFGAWIAEAKPQKKLPIEKIKLPAGFKIEVLTDQIPGAKDPAPLSPF